MTAAPFVAIAETKPRSIRSIRTGATPVLITCAPRPQTIPPPVRFASTMAPATALRSAAARMFGSDSMNAPADPFTGSGRPKSSVRALLGRDLSGYVLIPERSNSSYENFIEINLLFSEDQHGIAVTVE